ncbi:haloacid dehalogenase type II [Occultella glacieicola]|uniref:Haloacid dehalogenase type II n=1 Tax=Occultella glacieicola TaxID=2518684 RepID=A0ABY2DX48_9MICO|nr:haloacid dehalogenase type II [Occultella glacieicola]TDE88548.1 haloacid dehalogenase type II [Occultella glacieicola]
MDLTGYTPRYITFDCYGTLTNFQMSEAVRPLVADVLDPDDVASFNKDFRAYRIDEVLGAYKPYRQVLRDSWQRVCNRWKIQFRADDVEAIIQAVGSWGPHPDVPDALTKLAEAYPLVILSNAEDKMLENNVAQLGVDFHRVFTAEQVGAYKPRYAGFEYMLDQLDCGRHEILHVTSHIWYDIIPCHELRITNKVYVNRGYDPSTPFYEYAETTDLAGLPPLLGL